MQLMMVGMHRSGTSMAARLLNLMGAYFGTAAESTDSDLGEENPKGFWERKDVRAANETLLAAAHCSWQEVSRWAAFEATDEQRARFERLARLALLKLDFNRPWVTKDPRLCLTLREWLPLLDVPVVVLVLRNPDEVALSLQRRNGLPLETGLALWEAYMHHAARALGATPRVTLQHARMMADPVAACSELRDTLAAHGVTGLQVPQKDIQAFVSDALYRSRIDDLGEHFLGHPAFALFDTLSRGDAVGADAALSARSTKELEAHEARLAQVRKSVRRDLAGKAADAGAAAAADDEPTRVLLRELKRGSEQAAATIKQSTAFIKEAAASVSIHNNAVVWLQKEVTAQRAVADAEAKARRKADASVAALGQTVAALRARVQRLVAMRALYRQRATGIDATRREAAALGADVDVLRRSETQLRDELQAQRDTLQQQRADLARLQAALADALAQRDGGERRMRKALAQHDAAGAHALRERLRELRSQLAAAATIEKSVRQELRAAEQVIGHSLRSARWRAGGLFVRLLEMLLLRPAPRLAIEQLPTQLQTARQRLERDGAAAALARLSERGQSLSDEWRPAALQSSSPRERASTEAQAAAQIASTPALVTPTRIDIVVCVHNAPDDTRACLESILRWTENFALIVVDDGSEHGLAQWLREFAAESRAQITLLRNEQARGYTCAANMGLRASSADVVVLLNSDCLVTPGWERELLASFAVSANTGIVGPLSNAASWQSVPQLQSPDGRWSVNPDLLARDPVDVAMLVRRWSAGLSPTVPVVNGFCYAIRRAVLDQVGLLDEETFPRGYGEEDDFSIRCAQAGFVLRIADRAIVLHQKSKSFTPAGRIELVKASKEKLKAKHGDDVLRQLGHGIQLNEPFARARGRVAAALVSDGIAVPMGRAANALRIAWLQPHLRTVGGIRRCVEMSNRLVQRGHEVHVLTPTGEGCDWLPLAARTGRSDVAGSWDVLIVSDPDMVDAARLHGARRVVVYHLAAYNIYREPSAALDAFYTAFDRRTDVANSQWTAAQVTAHCGRAVDGVFPGGIDQRIFRPMPGTPDVDCVYYGSRRKHKGTAMIQAALAGRTSLSLEGMGAAQCDLARLFGRARVFVSAAWHEGFNFCPLEAMACGVPVVMTDCGGSREYAVHGENALVVPVEDQAALRAAVDTLLGDDALRVRLISNGLATAWRFDWTAVTRVFAEFLESDASPVSESATAAVRAEVAS